MSAYLKAFFRLGHRHLSRCHLSQCDLSYPCLRKRDLSRRCLSHCDLSTHSLNPHGLSRRACFNVGVIFIVVAIFVAINAVANVPASTSAILATSTSSPSSPPLSSSISSTPSPSSAPLSSSSPSSPPSASSSSVTPSPSPTLKQPMTPIPIETYRLKNGLRVVISPNHRAPVALISLWYGVGSGDEVSGLTGLSHMLEHMMYKGTAQWTAKQWLRRVAQFGGIQNAMTSQDYTVYFYLVSTEHIADLLEMEADRMRHLKLTADAFAKERQVVMEERRMRVDDYPQGLLWERFNAAAYLNSPYHNPVIGWMTDIKHYTLNDLTRWYQRWYHPNQAVLLVIGDVKPDALLKLATRYFGDIKPQAAPPLKPRREVPALGPRRVNLNVAAKQPQLMLGFQTPSLVTAKAAWQAYALELIAYVLDGGRSSRFNRDLIRGERLATQINVYYPLYQRHNTQFIISAVPSSGVSIKTLKKAILSELKQLKTKPVSPATLTQLKTQLAAEHIYEQDSLMHQFFNLGLPLMAGLPAAVVNRYLPAIDAITPEQIKTVAKRYFSSRRLTTAILQPRPKQGGE